MSLRRPRTSFPGMRWWMLAPTQTLRWSAARCCAGSAPARQEAFWPLSSQRVRSEAHGIPPSASYVITLSFFQCNKVPLPSLLSCNDLDSVFAAALLAAVLFGAVWSITEKECLPGGNLFGVTSLFICALIGGKLVALIQLPGLPPFPPLLGKAEDPRSTIAVCCLWF